MPLARRPASHIRVIAHVDLDCFYVQVEQRRQPELLGKPTAVIQYNPWKGGACIAVGYEARKFGVKRSMRGDDAKAVCPDINLVQVPVTHEKADLTIYRDAGSEVVAVLSRVGRCERASIDEVYLDITEAAEKLCASGELKSTISQETLKSHILGVTPDIEATEWFMMPDTSRDDQLLACGAALIADVRMAVLAETQFTCSAGIAHNKMLAKLSSGMHKPSQQTLVPSSSVEALLATLPVTKIGQLGGKLGHSLETDLNVKTVGDLRQYSESKLQDLYGVNTGSWLWNIARGINGDEVRARTLPKSHSSGKTFPGPRALKSIETVAYWLQELAATLYDRLQEDLSQNNRSAHLLTLHASCYIEGCHEDSSKFPSKSCPLRYDKITEDSRCLFERSLREFCSHQSATRKDIELSGSWTVTGLSVTASNIIPKPSGVSPITQYFGNASSVRSSEQHDGEATTSATSRRFQDNTEDTSSSIQLEVQPNNGSVILRGFEENNQNISSSIQHDAHEAATSNVQSELQLQESRESVISEASGNSRSNRKELKLTDLWQRKSASESSAQSKRKDPFYMEYKQEDIDETVLSELPREIQLELESRLGIKRQCRTKPSNNISAFFKSRT